jgi:hypothetical protein
MGAGLHLAGSVAEHDVAPRPVRLDRVELAGSSGHHQLAPFLNQLRDEAVVTDPAHRAHRHVAAQLELGHPPRREVHQAEDPVALTEPDQGEGRPAGRDPSLDDLVVAGKGDDRVGQRLGRPGGAALGGEQAGEGADADRPAHRDPPVHPGLAGASGQRSRR